MKRIVSLILICCLAMALSVGAFAAGKTEYTGGLSLSASEVEKGKTVDLTVTLPAEALATIQLGVEFDTDYLEITAIDVPGAEMDGFGLYAGSDVDTANANGLATFAYVGEKGENVLKAGTDDVITITFKALAVGTTTIAIAGDEHPMIMESLATDGYTPDKEYTPKNDSVTLTITEPAYVLGDVNMDGEINALDAALTYAVYNGYREFDSEAQAFAADVNGDGVVEAIDAAMIYAYFNGTLSAFPAE